jgi:hypothetical protein
VRDDRQLFRRCLRDEHPVERVAVVQRQTLQGMVTCGSDGEVLERLSIERLFEVVRGIDLAECRSRSRVLQASTSLGYDDDAETAIRDAVEVIKRLPFVGRPAHEQDDLPRGS